jgi:hypothetical protein
MTIEHTGTMTPAFSLISAIADNAGGVVCFPHAVLDVTAMPYHG